jgi:drug/metabolite transporter (DMT)-like permease
MGTQDLLAICLYGLVCVFSSIIGVKIRQQNWPVWSTMVTSMINMTIWTWVTKHSKMPLVNLSALYDVVGALAYFVGFAIYGEVITTIQWVGIFLMIFSLYLINSH